MDTKNKQASIMNRTGVNDLSSQENWELKINKVQGTGSKGNTWKFDMWHTRVFVASRSEKNLNFDIKNNVFGMT